MPRFIFSESEFPLATDYYYEANHSYNLTFPHFNAHTHNYYEIYFFISGKVQLVIENAIYNVKKGDILIIPPYYIHRLLPLDTEASYERMYLWITEYCLSSLQFNEHSLLKPLEKAVKQQQYLFHVNHSKDYQLMTNAIVQIAKSKSENFYGKELLNRSYLLQLFAILNRYVVEELNMPHIKNQNSLISKVLTYINENVSENITLDLLSDLFYINKYSLSKEFKEFTNLTIHNYLSLKRIAEAKQLMISGIPPTKVYTLCGFSDYSSFYRCFQKNEGISPKEYMHLIKK